MSGGASARHNINVDHGTPSAVEVSMARRQTISLRAARCLHIARLLADADGKVPGGQIALSKALGTKLRNVRYALAELQAQRLVERSGRLDVIVCGTPSAAVDDDIAPPPLVQRHRRDRGRLRNEPDARYPGGVADPEFRWLRARVGGLKRTNAAFKAERDEARALAAKLEARIARGAVADVATALVNDLRHSSDCANPDCALCLRIAEQLDDMDGPYIGIVGGG